MSCFLLPQCNCSFLSIFPLIKKEHHLPSYWSQKTPNHSCFCYFPHFQHGIIKFYSFYLKHISYTCPHFFIFTDNTVVWATITSWPHGCNKLLTGYPTYTCFFLLVCSHSSQSSVLKGFSLCFIWNSYSLNRLQDSCNLAFVYFSHLFLSHLPPILPVMISPLGLWTRQALSCLRPLTHAGPSA